MIIRRVKNTVAEAALFLFFLTAAPGAYAMSEMESREIRRVAIVQMVTIRQRRRALDRRYGRSEVIQYKFQFVS